MVHNDMNSALVAWMTDLICSNDQLRIRRDMRWSDFQVTISDVLGRPAMFGYDNGVGVDLPVQCDEVGATEISHNHYLCTLSPSVAKRVS
jgi:hypothetical protein